MKVVLPSPANIEPRYWNPKTQLARNNQRTEDGVDINQKIKTVTETIEDQFNLYTSAHKKFPLVEEFKSLCLNALNNQNKEIPRGKSAPVSLLDFSLQLINECETGKRLTEKGTPYSPNTIKIYRTFSNNLISFKEKYHHNLYFEDLEGVFFEDFKEHLTFNLKYSTNTLGKHLRTLKTITAEAKERGISNIIFAGKRFKAPTEEVDAIYLTETELEHLQGLDLSKKPRLERVRDLFLVGCWTGLRFSDFTNIIGKNIRDGFIDLKTQKTGNRVTIPVHKTLEGILKKYKGLTENSLPEAISNQKMNEYLKELGEEAGIDEACESSFTKAGKKILKKVPKYKLISTHTARRSFATNMYNSGVSPITIMAITGHKTETSFMKYIKTSPRQHAEALKAIWDLKAKLQENNKEEINK
ncbi:MAG: tyrosine-type recombinase/integrase [Sphingobacteriaceae bacterium]|nr:tyrosine-type recombinase/integrase [Sphingobacteriaceae bacterium]